MLTPQSAHFSRYLESGNSGNFAWLIYDFKHQFVRALLVFILCRALGEAGVSRPKALHKTNTRAVPTNCVLCYFFKSNKYLSFEPILIEW